MRPRRKIAFALAVLAAVAMSVIEDEGAPVFSSPNEPSAALDVRDAVSASGSPILLRLPARESLPRTKPDPFPARSRPPPPPPAVASAPPAPAPPPLPYRFAGEFVLPTETQAFLAKGDDVFQVREGETIDGDYRVESLKAGELVLLHLASGVRQTMRPVANDSAAPAPGTDAPGVAAMTASAPPSEAPARPVRRPRRIRRYVESTDERPVSDQAQIPDEPLDPAQQHLDRDRGQ
jgi:hypothetical protein